MNCALIDDDVDIEVVVVVGCAVGGGTDGIISAGMHEKRGKKTRTAEKGKGHNAALWMMMEDGEVSRGQDNNLCPKDKIPPGVFTVNTLGA